MDSLSSSCPKCHKRSKSSIFRESWGMSRFVLLSIIHQHVIGTRGCFAVREIETASCRVKKPHSLQAHKFATAGTFVFVNSFLCQILEIVVGQNKSYKFSRGITFLWFIMNSAGRVSGIEWITDLKLIINKIWFCALNSATRYIIYLQKRKILYPTLCPTHSIGSFKIGILYVREIL